MLPTLLISYIITMPLSEAAANLGSPDYAKREAATITLMNGKEKSLPYLKGLYKSGSLEASIRAVGILENTYISVKDKGIDDAEAVLQDYTIHAPPAISQRATEILRIHEDIAARRATVLVRSMNGKVEVTSKPTVMGIQEGERVVILPSWTGGNEGLRQIARIKSLTQIYQIRGAKVSDDKVNELRRDLPNVVEISKRSPVRLGIEFTPNSMGAGCIVSSVVGNTARMAGLEPFDKIVEMDGKPLKNCDDLVAILNDYKLGDTVVLTVSHTFNDDRRSVKVKLEGWE